MKVKYTLIDSGKPKEYIDDSFYGISKALWIYIYLCWWWGKSRRIFWPYSMEWNIIFYIIIMIFPISLTKNGRI